MEYTLRYHQHCFAIWTIGKIVRLTLDEKILMQRAVESSTLAEKIQQNQLGESQNEFNLLFESFITHIRHFFEESAASISYGNASLIVSTYVKCL